MAYLVNLLGTQFLNAVFAVLFIGIILVWFGMSFFDDEGQ